MFNGRGKSDEQTVPEMLSSYLDNQLDARERDQVEQHLVSCDNCRSSLNTLEITIGMLHRMPVAPLPRSFTLTEEPQRRFWDFFNTPNTNWLRVATATAVVMLAFLLAGDFSGLLRTEITPDIEQPLPQVSSVITQPVEDSLITPELSADGSNAKAAATVPESAEAAPVMSAETPSENGSSRIAQSVDPIAGELSTSDAISAVEATRASDPSLQAPVVPNDDEALPNSSAGINPNLGKEISIWLRSLELVLALSIIVLGAVAFQTWRKWRTFSSHN